MAESADRNFGAVDEVLAREARNTAREIFSYTLAE